MKNIFIYLFALISFSTIAQQMQVSIDDASTPKPSGKTFLINIEYVNVNTSCNEKKIELNLGQLEFLPNATVIGNAKAVLSTVNSDNILTLTNIPFQIGSHFSFKIGVRFREGVTCNGSKSVIQGKFFDCDKLSVTSNPIEIRASSSCRSKLTLSQVTSYDKKSNLNNAIDNAFCLGKLVRYSLKHTNYDYSNPDGVNFNAPIIYLEIPKCANIKGVYKYNSYENVNSGFKETVNGNVKTISWIGTNLPFSSTINYLNVYDIEIEYPCTNLECIGSPELSVYAIAKDCNNQDMETVLPRFILQTKMLPKCDDSCISGGIEGSRVKFNGYLTCPSSCSAKSNSATITFLTANANTSNSDLVREYKITLPNGIKLSSAYLYNNGNYCNSQVQTSYLDQNNIPTNQANAKYVIFKVPCFDLTYEVRAQFSFDFTNPLTITSGSSFVFGATASINNQITVPYQEFTASVNYCAPSIEINKSLKKITNGNIGAYDIQANAVSNDVFVYRIKVYNSGEKEQVNMKLVDQLDSRLIYLGGLKIAYTSDSNLTNIPLVYGNTFTLPNLNNTIRITKPAINNSNGGGTLIMDNFNFPCNASKYLIIEFKVKIKPGVYADGNSIKNVVNLNGSASSNVTQINLIPITEYKTQFLVWCEDNQEWYDDYVMIRRNENTKLKLRVINTGTKDIKLQNILNLRPLANDTFESNTDPRNTNVPFELKYDCLKNPTVYLDGNQLNNTQVQVDFASNGVDMNRQSLVCSYSQNGSIPNFSNSCNPDSSNWMKVDFKQGLLIKPGQTIEVVYNAKATGNELGTIRNSFATLAFDTNDRCLLSPIQKMDIEKTEEGCKMTPPKPCNECSSFELIKNKKYLVSGWVREESEKEPSKQYLNFEKSYISVAFTDKYEESFQDPIKFLPSGEIIDGWQRIIGEFTVPQESAEFYLELVNDSNASTNQDGTLSYFDDIRIIPSEGNMKSFVYDQKTQRLMAELDENNYSTFYEYDLEGGLIRIKKETEKGVFTIQETRKGSTISKETK
ncbi:hypothetical protein FLACOL_01618 [Flavobacterium columnare]|uniref:Isopeptide-forming domain-containing fimbrial protein n=2 Tax=Flavobacterium TaxID=237 RepID=A0ABW8PKH7_9FLAO|nr:isopeptide-forming domain-containing fimbrial protein [Flavobacterium columnare]SPE77622.1 hypothetical protein FLACOL_01618 [Flavobacterium columnare]